MQRIGQNDKQQLNKYIPTSKFKKQNSIEFTRTQQPGTINCQHITPESATQTRRPNYIEYRGERAIFELAQNGQWRYFGRAGHFITSRFVSRHYNGGTLRPIMGFGVIKRHSFY